MSNGEKYENVVLGSGSSGRLLAWTLASAGHRTAIVERGPFGGACPNVACMPSKNIIHSAKVAALAKRGAEFGLKINSLSIDMAIVQRRTEDGRRPSGILPQQNRSERCRNSLWSPAHTVEG